MNINSNRNYVVKKYFQKTTLYLLMSTFFKNKLIKNSNQQTYKEH